MRGWVIALALDFLYPLGLVLTWLRRDWSVRRRAGLSGLAGVLFLVPVVPPLGAENPAFSVATPPTAASPRSSVSSPPPTVSPTPSVSASASTPAPDVSAAPAPKPGTALDALATLRVAGRGPLTGYSREKFGPA